MYEDLPEPKWFTLQTLSNQEYKVKASIETIIKENNLSDVISEILIPSETVSEVKNGKKHTRTRKFYPGYVFILMRMYDKNGEILQTPWQLVRNANGVVRFVGNNNPVALKENEISDIIAKMQAVEGKSVPKISYNVGEIVKINDGPFLNLTGEIEAIDTEAGRLRVQVSMFGRLTPVDFEFWQVKRAEAGDN
ncbi:MAG: transcription termination/antitermination protein NusG [Puniceicoccales bacterium]|jgi:transcriptional antiterminator NusG|nr:transcription termination/antitermination protein NusG [Puniceicoccales bacterium]